MIQIHLLVVLLSLNLSHGYSSMYRSCDSSPFRLHAKKDDKDMVEALRYLETHRKKPKSVLEANSLRSSSTTSSRTKTGKSSSAKGKPMSNDEKAAIESYEEDTREVVAPKVFAKQTIWGQNIIVCRPFSIDSKRSFDFVGSYTDAAAVPTYPMPEIAFLGRSNVGKSSLLNCITGLNKNIAVASKTPGRTRCINQFKCKDNEGDICTFVDLPGYGFAKIARDRQEDISSFLRAYLQDRGNLRLAVLLVDIRREAQEQDLGMYEFLEYEGIPTAVVATKCDKLKPNEMSSALSSLQAAFKMKSAPLAFSSETGLGRKDMWRLIRKGIVGEEGSGDGDGDEPEEEDEEAEEPYDEDGDEDYADGYFK